MLRHAREILGLAIGATDGDVGHVRDLYFDDEPWVIRYLVVETGTWLASRKVLVSPIAIGETNWISKKVPARLTCEQVRNSPGIDTDKPVSRQHELEFCSYYGYPYYWGYSALGGAGYYPGAMLTGIGNGGSGSEYLAAQVEQEWLAHEAGQRQDVDPHLRSCEAVTGYHINALDGEIGHAQGMLVDEESWAIRYLIVNTSNWWLGHQMLIAPESITEVSWLDRKVVLDLKRQAIQEAPPYDRALLPDPPGETLVYERSRHNRRWRYDSPSPPSPRVSSSAARSLR